jgi:hypothetical protein
MGQRTGCLNVTIGGCGLVSLLVILGCGGLIWLVATAPAPPPGSKPARPPINAGDRVLIAAGHNAAYLAYDSEGSWEALIQAENTGDVRNVLNLIEAGRVWGVAGGTEATVIRRAFASALVRVADGERIREGWIQIEELSPAP